MGLRQSLLDVVVFDLKGLYDLTLELQCDNIFSCLGSKPFSLPSEVLHGFSNWIGPKIML